MMASLYQSGSERGSLNGCAMRLTVGATIATAQSFDSRYCRHQLATLKRGEGQWSAALFRRSYLWVVAVSKRRAHVFRKSGGAPSHSKTQATNTAFRTTATSWSAAVLRRFWDPEP